MLLGAVVRIARLVRGPWVIQEYFQALYVATLAGSSEEKGKMLPDVRRNMSIHAVSTFKLEQPRWGI